MPRSSRPKVGSCAIVVAILPISRSVLLNEMIACTGAICLAKVKSFLAALCMNFDTPGIRHSIIPGVISSVLVSCVSIRFNSATASPMNSGWAVTSNVLSVSTLYLKIHPLTMVCPTVYTKFTQDRDPCKISVARNRYLALCCLQPWAMRRRKRSISLGAYPCSLSRSPLYLICMELNIVMENACQQG
jgi:hypothetical protein